MDDDPPTFPSRSWLQRGVTLATIACAIWVADYPEGAEFLSWDGMNYSRLDAQGTRGTVSFAPNQLVAGFRDDRSARAPWHFGARYNIADHFSGITPELWSLAEQEALQYMLDEWNGQVAPIITAAFWGHGEALSAAYPWSEIYEHGAHLLRLELLAAEEAADGWQEQFEWNGHESELLRSLFDRKMNAGDSTIAVDKRLDGDMYDWKPRFSKRRTSLSDEELRSVVGGALD